MWVVTARRVFPYILLGCLVVSIAYATAFGTLPKADLTFNNNTEPKTIDPAVATGVPEHRILEGLFEGLLRRLPDPRFPAKDAHANRHFSPQLATADKLDISADGLHYTFHIRPTAQWSDGTPVTAHDFAWSWRRTLHPDTASEYAYQLFYVQGARDYQEMRSSPNRPVEIELDDRPNPAQTFPRGTMLRGTLIEKLDPPDANKKREPDPIFRVRIDEQIHLFSRANQLPPTWYKGADKIEHCRHVLPDFEKTVGIEVPSDDVLKVTLTHPTPFFADLVAFYPLYPVQRASIEKHGAPSFTRPENLVTNGPFRLSLRRIRDRLRLEKNDKYWNANQVTLQTVDAFAVSSDIAALNMYETGQIDWLTSVPANVIAELKKRDDFYSAPMFSTYFYRVNCTHAALRDKRVRRALAMSIEKPKICENVTKAGEVPSDHYVPPLFPEYRSPPGPEFNVEAARALLAEAGYPNGQNFPRIEILYNTHETHQAIAEVVQEDWKRFLGIDVELRGLEWGSYLDAQQKLQYNVSRAGWTADYPDPNTYLDMFVTGGANNQTGWSNPRYDELIAQAAEEVDVNKRLEILKQAEVILLDELPILPVYSYVSKNMVRPRVTGFFPNTQDVQPLHILGVNRGAQP